MSNRQREVLAESKAFKLVKRRKKDRMWYEVQLNPWSFSYSENVDNEINQVRDFFDPLRNKGGKWGTHWKYSNRKDAEQMFVTATLKWPGTPSSNSVWAG